MDLRRPELRKWLGGVAFLRAYLGTGRPTTPGPCSTIHKTNSGPLSIIWSLEHKREIPKALSHAFACFWSCTQGRLSRNKESDGGPSISTDAMGLRCLARRTGIFSSGKCRAWLMGCSFRLLRGVLQGQKERLLPLHDGFFLMGEKRWTACVLYVIVFF